MATEITYAPARSKFSVAAILVILMLVSLAFSFLAGYGTYRLYKRESDIAYVQSLESAVRNLHDLEFTIIKLKEANTKLQHTQRWENILTVFLNKDAKISWDLMDEFIVKNGVRLQTNGGIE